MTFIVVLVALLIERFFDWSHLRNWSWYFQIESLVTQKISGVSPYLVMAAAIVPPLLVVIVIEYVLKGMLYGFPLLVFQLVVLLYCFGAKNLWADAFSSITSFTQANDATALDSFRELFSSVDDDDAIPQHLKLMNLIFTAANNRVFAVVFWYGILGLPGALLYRLVSVSALGDTQDGAPESSELKAAGHMGLAILDWIPVRIFSLMFAVGGKFNQVVTVWRKYVMLGMEGNQLLLAECGAAAVVEDPANIPSDGTLERNAVSLLDRVFIVVLAASLVLVFLF